MSNSNYKRSERKPSSKRNNRKGSDVTPERDERKNDPSTWNKGVLAQNAGRIPFVWPMGSKIDLSSPWLTAGGATQTINSFDADKFRFPGIMKLPFAPCFGLSKNSDDPVNLAAQAYYAKVRIDQNGGKNYDPVDLMMYYCAMDSVFTWHAELVRLYGVLMNYSQWNYYTPKVVVEALGFDYEDIILHIDELRFHINYLANRLNIWNIPKNIDFFARHIMLASNLFWDSPTIKSQLYVYVPAYYGRFVDETDGPGYLAAAAKGSNQLTFSDILNFTSLLCTNITLEQSFGIMNGDTVRAYGKDNCYTINEIADNYVCEPVYSKEILGQIMNISVMDEVGYTEGKMLYQDNTDQLLHSNVDLLVTVPMYDSNRVMRSFVDTPTPDEVMINSRGMIMGEITERADATHWRFVPSSLGTEIVFKAQIYLLDPAASEGYTRHTFAMYRNLTYSTIGELGYFGDHPLVYHVTSNGDGTVYNATTIGDTNSFAIITTSQLDMLHTAALMSVFNIPSYGRIG